MSLIKGWYKMTKFLHWVIIQLLIVQRTVINMNKFIFGFAVLVAVTSAMPQARPGRLHPEIPTESEVEQNNNAQYQFSSDIEDHINDLTQKRVEVRDGASVKGMYSYSDGYYRRTIEYIADENGYRVVNEEVVPLDGPKINLNGKATVINAAHGTELKYSVQSVPVEGPTPKILNQLE